MMNLAQCNPFKSNLILVSVVIIITCCCCFFCFCKLLNSVVDRTKRKYNLHHSFCYFFLKFIKLDVCLLLSMCVICFCTQHFFVSTALSIIIIYRLQAYGVFPNKNPSICADYICFYFIVVVIVTADIIFIITCILINSGYL